MKIDDILGIINNLDYDDVKEVEIPVSHLMQLKQEILTSRTLIAFLKGRVSEAKADHRAAIAESIKILVNQERNSTVKFNSYT